MDSRSTFSDWALILLESIGTAVGVSLLLALLALLTAP